MVRYAVTRTLAARPTALALFCGTVIFALLWFLNAVP